MPKVERRIPRPALACLLLEIGFLIAAAIFRISDTLLIPGISFTATLQTLSFTHLEGITYSSVMTTGNLRCATKRFFDGFLPLRRDEKAYHDAFLLGTISFSFFTGAFIGTHATVHYAYQALGIVVFWLTLVLAKVLFLWNRRHNRK